MPFSMSVAEQPLHQVGINRQVLRPQDRISIGLQVGLDLVADAGIHVIGPRQHQDAGPIVFGAPAQDRAPLVLHLLVECRERLVTGADRASHLCQSEAGNRVLQRAVQLLRHDRRFGQRDERRDVFDAAFGEHIAFLQKTRLDVFRRRHHARACQRIHHMPVQEGRQRTDHRRQQDIDVVLLAEHQLAIVAGHAFHRIAAIHSAAAPAIFAPLFVGGRLGENDAARIEAERDQKAEPELVGRPDIEDARNPDAQLRP